MKRIVSLYPQYQRSEDRRKQNIPVAVERRSGKDRRSEDRVVLDKQLTKDIFEVKSHLAKLDTFAPGLFVDRVSSQAPTFASRSVLGTDNLQKTVTKPDFKEIKKEEEKLQDRASMSFQIGVLSTALAGAIAISFMGPTAAVIALGTTAYIGARVLKAVMVKEMQETSDKKGRQKQN